VVQHEELDVLGGGRADHQQDQPEHHGLGATDTMKRSAPTNSPSALSCDDCVPRSTRSRWREWEAGGPHPGGNRFGVGSERGE
jgi:hypothetical protein